MHTLAFSCTSKLAHDKILKGQWNQFCLQVFTLKETEWTLANKEGAMFILLAIKTHGSVLCGPRNQLGVCNKHVYFTGVKKTACLRICSSTLPEQKQKIFSVQILWEHFQFQIWVESAKLFWKYALSKFIIFSSYFFLLFAILFEITITQVCSNGLPWNLEHY